MRWSLRLGKIFGITVQVHLTFFLLIGWIYYRDLEKGESWIAASKGVALVLAVFGCVVLHEFGHALAARRYGIATRDITLLPIGGVARLERMPERPEQELVVAIAGPAVNVAIAALILGVLAALGRVAEVTDSEKMAADFLLQLLGVNVFLTIFNLIPAFPMDGGRVLRAFLALRLDYRRATRLAAAIGQGFAMLFAVAGLFGNPMLVLIAIFVYFGARGEAEMVGVQQGLRGRVVRDAMLTRFRVLDAAATLSDGVAELLAGSQQDFPVVEEGRLIGLLERNDLVKAIHDGARESSVRSVLRADCPTLDAGESLQVALERMRRIGRATLPVLEAGQLVGLLTLENIGELLMVGEAARTARGGDPSGR
jgi:Zn-dependent protease/CBS domain-containing protein